MSFCETYCSHGGICELLKGHDGPHDTGYCRFTDAESVPRAIADAELIAKGGKSVVELQEAIKRLAEVLGE